MPKFTISYKFRLTIRSRGVGGDALILLTSMNVYVQSIRLKDIAKVIRTLAKNIISNDELGRINTTYSIIAGPHRVVGVTGEQSNRELIHRIAYPPLLNQLSVFSDNTLYSHSCKTNCITQKTVSTRKN